jgi:hypothetical protein
LETRNITLTPIITKQACKEPCEFVRNLMDYGKYPIWCMKCDKSWPKEVGCLAVTPRVRTEFVTAKTVRSGH